MIALIIAGAGTCLAYPPDDYPYAADAQRASKVRAAVPALRRCMTEARVTKMLGEPDLRRTLAREGTDGKVPAMVMMIYILTQRSSELAESDAQVVVWMSLSKRVKAVSVYGIPGLANLDGMANEKCSS